MKILVACEFSGTVRDAFIRNGHDAVSCDLLPTEAKGPHMQTITTLEELNVLIDQTPSLYVRWSNGPEADAANGWISRRWCPLDIYDDEGQVIDTEPEGAEESGLSATLVLGPAAIVQWHGDVYGETCYLLTGNEAGLCSDDEPLLSSPEPIAYVSMDLVNEIYDGLRLGAYR